MSNGYRIDVLDAYGNRLGSGGLLTVFSLDDTRKLDSIGDVRFSLSAADPRANLITAGCQFDIYDEVDGYLGRFFFKEKMLNAADEIGTLDIFAHDALVELRRTLVGFNRNYDYDPIDGIIAELVGLASGWAQTIDSGLGSAALTLQGESVLTTIGEIAERFGKHYRLGDGTKHLEFGAFGEQSEVVLTNLPGQIQSMIANLDYIAMIETFRMTEDGDEIFNQIIPLSNGTGEAQFGIGDATLGTLPVVEGTNADGSKYYYVQDTDSVTTYGARPRIVQFPSIRPISNNATDIQYAVEMLKIAAEAYLDRSKAPKVEISIVCRGLRTNIKPGEQVRIVYRGVSSSGTYVDINDLYWVLDVVRTRRIDGERTCRITLMNVDDRRKTDTDVVVDVVKDLAALRLHIQPYPFWSENTWVEPFTGSTSPTAQRDAEFKLEIDNSVTLLTKVRLRFKTRPLYTLTQSYIEEVYTPGLSDIKDHYYFGVSKASHYPGSLSLEINGVDVTGALGGPWGNYSAEDTFTVDITDYIINASGGMYQEHSIVIFSTSANSGEARVNTGYFSQTSNINHGLIELNVRVQGITQGILPV